MKRNVVYYLQSMILMGAGASLLLLFVTQRVAGRMAMAGGKNITETVRNLIEPTADSLGLMLWDVQFVHEGARQVLRVTIDKTEGVTIDDCEAMHRAIDPLLDEADPIETAYELEVTSPGIEREISTNAHIDACIGEEVNVKLFAPLDGKKSYVGLLVGHNEDDAVVIDDGGKKIAFPRKTVAKIRTVFHF